MEEQMGEWVDMPGNFEMIFTKLQKIPCWKLDGWMGGWVDGWMDGWMEKPG